MHPNESPVGVEPADPSDRRVAKSRRCRAAAAVVLLWGASCAPVLQRADPAFKPVVSSPAFPAGEGPVVLIDAAHHNYHTAAGRYAPFAELLRRDGYVVRDLSLPASRETLADGRILVIANSIAERNVKKWKLPTDPAFSEEERAAIRDWVRDGGALLLIADHMPFPGAASGLAAEFGILFSNGFVVDESGAGKIVFRRDDGSLANHPITRGREASESIDSVVTFMGQAFRAEREIEPLLILGRETTLLMPVTAWKFSERTPRLPASGMLQGAVFRFGSGRVAVFGEAAMFSAQEQLRGEQRTLMGMNAPEAAQNPRFLLNVMHWLSGGEAGR